MITLDNTKSRTELGIVYRNNRDTYLSMAYDLIEKGLVPDKTKNIKKK